VVEKEKTLDKKKDVFFFMNKDLRVKRRTTG
jgi:hypothetical protein